MKATSEFVTWIVDQLEPLGAVRARAMFGGYGVYRADLMFALVAGDVLYLKADEASSGAFEARGTGPFVYSGKKDGRPVRMSYWEVPSDVLEDAEALVAWARVAIGVAERSRKPARNKA